MADSSSSTLTKEEYEDIRNKLHDEFWPLVAPEDDPASKQIEWHHKGGKSLETTGIVLKHDHPKYGVVWRVDAILPLSAAKYYEVFAKGLHVNWVKSLEAFEILERNDVENWSVAWSVIVIGYGMTKRDFVTLQCHNREDDGTFYDMLIKFPKAHPKDPNSSKYVRGEYFPSGNYVRPYPGDPNKCHYTFINNYDFRGYIPMRIIHLFSASFMVEYGKALIEECKKVNNGEHAVTKK